MLLLALGVAVIFVLIVFLIWLQRSSIPPREAAEEMRALGVDFVRLPGRLRRVAADPRTPRRARWWLIGLSLYIMSPIDLIPDVLPVIGLLDEIVLVPLVLRYVKRMIPETVWTEQFPPRTDHALAITPDSTEVQTKDD